jgi:hypothetical protein
VVRRYTHAEKDALAVMAAAFSGRNATLRNNNNNNKRIAAMYISLFFAALYTHIIICPCFKRGAIFSSQ